MSLLALHMGKKFLLSVHTRDDLKVKLMQKNHYVFIKSGMMYRQKFESIKYLRFKINTDLKSMFIIAFLWESITHNVISG